MSRDDPPPIALSIAGSDSSGGAGVQADLKTFHRLGVYGASALTLITAQNTLGVRALHLLPPDLVAEQIAAVAEDLDVRAAKTGALGSVELIAAVAKAVERHSIPNLVVDPVIVSKHGDPLLPAEAIETLKTLLVSRATLVTPNLRETAALIGKPIETEDQMRDAARFLRSLGARAALVKGGQLPGSEAVDIFYDGDRFVRLAARRLDTRRTHGAGCTYSAAITALLARGESLVDAVRHAKEFMGRALSGAPRVGRGCGPVDHWA